MSVGYSPFQMLKHFTTLTQATSIGFKSIPYYKYLLLYVDFNPTASLNPILRFNNDSAANYSNRASVDSAADTTSTAATSIQIGATNTSPQQCAIFIINTPSNEKLLISWNV